MEHGLASSFRADGDGLPDRIAEAARAAEDAGLASWWSLGEREAALHRSLDPVLGLQCVARVTDRIRLGHSGELAAVQPAAVRAKQLASLDWFAGGRLELGLDLGEPPEDLVDPAAPEADHLDRALDRVLAMRSLWTQRRAEHTGAHVSFTGVSALPRPVGDRVPRTHLRALGTEALRRVVDQVGAPHGWLAWRETPEQVGAGAARLASVLGDAADGVRLTWFVDLADLADARAALSGMSARVDELVAVVDRVPTADDIDRVVQA
ncbi:LLM class flavin-dependent oxidoreductase [Nocardioides hwasunensis]|uniref:LLM class flavin-dependent oxidoreductase n=1 Tax=Nocardioides hwasunensis TaxID=397258 RepID=A0ABR8MM63_9ACTN|nr:LLM class flavin-dependent oxidoreductase [Nocardioides hwasunensis]MBD3915614.1 LLM class flavin-dependent oxidoreductase [Nocardioides hwasunensis]